MSMENLVELQGIDTKLKDLNDLLGDLPSKVEGLNQQEESIKSSLQSKKDRVKELEVELHKKEVDISQLDGKVGSLKDQLFLVTNNKQYDALMKEIDYLKEKKSVSENETIELLDEKEKLLIQILLDNITPQQLAHISKMLNVDQNYIKSVSVKLFNLVVKFGSSGLIFKTEVLFKKISAKQALL